MGELQEEQVIKLSSSVLILSQSVPLFSLNSYSCLCFVGIKNFIGLGDPFSPIFQGENLYFVHLNLAFMLVSLEAKSWLTF